MEEPAQTVDPISRSDSPSTTASAALTQLPDMSVLAASNVVDTSSLVDLSQHVESQEDNDLSELPLQHPRISNGITAPVYTGATPAATSGGMNGTMPTCQNCGTSTTPLWRRDEYGSVLCNACGLFLKLHNRARPISLKTDVIKSRNRVKTMRPDLLQKKREQAAAALANAENGDSTPVNTGQTRKKAVAAQEALESSAARANRPSPYSNALQNFIVDDPYNSAVGDYGIGPDGQVLSTNGDRSSDTPQTHEQLVAQNSSLKTRVSEFEVINELFRGRLAQLEQQEDAARQGQEAADAEQSQLRSQLEAAEQSEKQVREQLADSHRRENNLKRRLDELEIELKAAQEATEEPERAAKRIKVDSKSPATDD